jgi:hypothetical protein
MKNTLNIKEWAKEQVIEHIKTIRYYISEGWNVEKAIKTVLDGSCIGSGYKAQIVCEIKSTINNQ